MTLRVERDVIQAEMMDPVEPDPKWLFVDARGHEHRWVGYEVPTTEPIEIARYFCPDCRDEHVESEPRCRLCGEVVWPGYRPAPNPMYIQGQTHYYLDDEEITKAQYESLVAGL